MANKNPLSDDRLRRHRHGREMLRRKRRSFDGRLRAATLDLADLRARRRWLFDDHDRRPVRAVRLQRLCQQPGRARTSSRSTSPPTAPRSTTATASCSTSTSTTTIRPAHARPARRRHAGLPRRDDRHRGRQLLHQPRHQHQGPRPRRLGEPQPVAADESVFEGTGGSSITQQLVKNVYIPRKTARSAPIDRKIKEIVYALELTKRYSKDQILDWYVNQISYGGIYNGVEAAAQGYFGKSGEGPHAGRSGAARRHPAVARRLRPGQPPRGRHRPPQRGPRPAGARRSASRSARPLLRRDAGRRSRRAKPTPLDDQPPSASRSRRPTSSSSTSQPQLEALFGHDALLHDGLVITTTLDIDLQHQAQDIMEQWIQAVRERLQQPQRRPRWSSTRRPARSSRWSAAATTSATTSTARSTTHWR